MGRSDTIRGARALLIGFVLAGNLGAQLAAQEVPDRKTKPLPVVRIGAVLDSLGEPTPGYLAEFRESLFAMTVQEIESLTAQEFDVRFPPDKLLGGRWDPATVRNAFEQLLADPEVDVVLALGPLSTALACAGSGFAKPVIAPFVIDVEAQGVPIEGDSSGVHNLNYVTLPLSLRQQIERYREIVDFERLHFIYDGQIEEVIPEVPARTLQLTEDLGVEAVDISISVSADEALDRLGDDAEAVFILPLPRLTVEETRKLLAGINERRLPSLSYFGETLLEDGALLSLTESTSLPRLARRIALNLQRTLLGEDPGTLPVVLEQRERVTINMATARAIRWYPTWDVLIGAQLIGEQREPAETTWALDTVALEAVRVNLDVRTAEREVAAGAQEVRQARSGFRPRLDASLQGLVIDDDRAQASFGQQAERTLSGALGLTQVVWSDPVWANARIQSRLQSAREAGFDSTRLDVALEATTAFLDVLRAESLERIAAQNVRLTEDNLRVAQRRQALGVTGPAEVYRWESQLATDRQTAVGTRQRVNVARSVLNRVLNRPIEQPFETRVPDLMSRDLVTGEGRLRPFVNNPWAFELFREFMVDEGLERSPELRGLDETIAAQERALLSSRRSFWSPEIGLFGDLNERFVRRGAGSEPIVSIPGMALADDTDWSVGVQVSLPLYEGGFRRAEVRRNSETLSALRDRRAATAERIELGIRARLFEIAASSTAIDLSAEAAAAARKSYDLVQQSYSQGTVSILALLDGQNNAIVAEAVAANAVYDFLIDLMEVQRSTVNFDFFRSAEDRDNWFEKLEQFFEAARAEEEER